MRCPTFVYHLNPNAAHGFFNRTHSVEHFEATRQRVDEFLVSLGWLRSA